MSGPAGFMKEPAGFVAFSEAHVSEAHVPFFQFLCASSAVASF